MTPRGSVRAGIMTALLRGFATRPNRGAHLFLYLAALPLLIAWVFTVSPSQAASAGAGRLSPGELSLPAQYGTIIYRTNEQSPRQLFIVGISHRDAENRSNHHNTAQVQLETFRIGEWLHRNLDLELLLPEGYFNGNKNGSCRGGHAAPDEMAADKLYARLADDSRFVNAEMLLMEQCGMHATQVEDRNGYDAVCNCLGELTSKSCPRMQMEAKVDELQYLQEIRTARILQKIPAAIETELCAGTIRKRYAMLTLGMNHLQDIIRYLQQDMISIKPPVHGDDRMASYRAELDLLREGYGVTVIIPRTLADDRLLLQATHLDRMLPAGNAMLPTSASVLPPQ